MLDSPADMMMRTRLYLLIKSSPDLAQALLPSPRSVDERTRVVLLQEAVQLDPGQFPAPEIYLLGDDAVSHHVTPSVPAISYRELLDMIFEANSVVAL